MSFEKIPGGGLWSGRKPLNFSEGDLGTEGVRRGSLELVVFMQPRTVRLEVPEYIAFRMSTPVRSILPFEIRVEGMIGTLSIRRKNSVTRT